MAAAPADDRPTVSVDRTIAASPEALWDRIADVTRMDEWSPESAGATWTGGATGPAVGARFRGRNRRGWHRWSTTCTVTEADRPRCFEFAVTFTGFAVATWRYEFAPADDGSTLVTERWTDDRGILARLGGIGISGVRDRAAHNRATMTATLERLAAAAEGSPAPTSS